MNFSHKRIFFNLFLAFLLFFLHIFAMKFSWYYLHYEFDMLPHFLGGLVVFLTIQNIFLVFKRDVRISRILFLVFLVTVFWEFFEIYLDSTFGVNYARGMDSISDIFIGMLGATVVAFFTGKNLKNVYNKRNEE